MSGRNRGRGNPNQDADEERRLWKEIKDKSKEVDGMVSRSNEIGHEIITVEAQQAALLESSKPSRADLDERLEKLYRENLKLCEEVQHILEGKSNEMNLLDSLNILAGLREASEAQAPVDPAPRSATAGSSGKLGRVTKKTKVNTGAAVAAKEAEVEDDVPAAPSPKIHIGRLNKEKPSRAGSVSATRETSVKVEDGAESVASSADGAASTTATTTGGKSSIGGSSNRTTNRLVLTKGEVVFCRHDMKSYPKDEPPEGEGILCRVTAVIGEGKQRRYEVQDADTSGEAPPPQRASVSQLIQIPESNFKIHGGALPDLAKGRNVLAQYPDTTTFYKAEVCVGWRTIEGKELVNLRFEDDEAARDVERKFVLTEK
ncbi:hypothetical protein LTR37_004997 [Vermiconidia calcicola]|uniref:Uncharacterized protein n=1 Tax=Vermiconidia calcicola TaxID=1690605 RepID=A0ACC3NKC1_9PEZI|nr:hypothetical protein LTR37_004997 [Vermiconidia calcicola]